jgi:glyoxylase-like metal-dependent hydrolase (beta-lactamase superfamily II)
MHYEDTQAEIHARRRTHGQQRVRPALQGDRRGGAARRGQRAREAARAVPRLGVRKVLETHGHWDHIQAVPAVRDAGYEVGVTAADAAMLPSYDFVLEDEP